MSQLEILGRDDWQEFLESPAAVLMLGKSDCENCRAWTEELTSFLESQTDWQHVRFGKLELDQPGLGAFKSNPWLAEIDDLPYNVLYRDGQRRKEFVGSGVGRLENRMRRVFEA